jgi:hypothetical protein
MMRTSRRATAVLLTAAIGAFGFAPASPPSAQTGGEAHVLSIVGSATATVELDEDLTVSLVSSENPSLGLFTEAGFASAVLVGRDGDRISWSRVDPSLLCEQGSPASCTDLLSDLQVIATGFEDAPNGLYALIVPAGKYRLHVVASDAGAATTATLTDPTLAEAMPLVIDTIPDHKVLVQTDVLAPSGAGLVSGGGTGVIANDGGTLVRFVAATGSLTGSAEVGDCVYRGDPPVPALAYAPPCATGSSTSVRLIAAGNVFTYVLNGLSADVPAGRLSQGGYVAGPILADAGVIITVWVG